MMRVSGAPSMRMKQRHAGSKRGTARAGQLTDSSTRVKFVKRVTSWRQVLQTARGSGLRADVRQRLLAYALFPFVAISSESDSAANGSDPGRCNAYCVDNTQFGAVRVAARLYLQSTECQPKNQTATTSALPPPRANTAAPRPSAVSFPSSTYAPVDPASSLRLDGTEVGIHHGIGAHVSGYMAPGLYAILRLLHLLCHRCVSALFRQLLQERTHV